MRKHDMENPMEIPMQNLQDIIYKSYEISRLEISPFSEVILTSRHDWVRYRPFLQAADGMLGSGPHGEVLFLSGCTSKKSDSPARFWTCHQHSSTSSTQLGDLMISVKQNVSLGNHLNGLNTTSCSASVVATLQ